MVARVFGSDGSTRYRIAWTLALMMCLVMFLAFHLFTGALDGVVSWDEADYALSTQNSWSAHALDLGRTNQDGRHWHAPLSFYLLKLAVYWGGLNETTVRLPGVWAAVLACGLAVLAAHDLARGSAGLRLCIAMASGLILATAPALASMVQIMKPHSLVTLFLILNLWTLARYLRRPSISAAAWFGLTLAGQCVSMEYGPIVAALSLFCVLMVRPEKLGLRWGRPWIIRSANGWWPAVHREMVVSLAACVGAILLIWPAGILKLHVLLNFAYNVHYAAGGHPILFRGQMVTHAPRYAYLYWYAVDHPWLLGAWLAGMGLIGWWAWHQRSATAITLAVMSLGLAAAVHGSHIMDLCYSLFMIPPVALGLPLAVGWAMRQAKRNRCASGEHRQAWDRGIGWVGLTILVMVIAGGQWVAKPAVDRSNERIVALAMELSQQAGPGEQVLAQAWPVVKYVLVRQGRSDVIVHRYDPRNVEQDQLLEREKSGAYRWAITIGPTSGARLNCPMLARLHESWSVVMQAGAPPREYRLYHKGSTGPIGVANVPIIGAQP